MTRNLYCPVCGAALKVHTDGGLPETYRLPEHVPRDDVILCQAMVVKVVIEYDECRGCGRKISRHPSGLCSECFADKDNK